MAVVVPPPPALAGDLSLFHTTDPLLSNLPVFVFHGPASTIAATSSRIQVHIFTAAGHASYSRLAVSPNSPFYSAVSNLPREEQGDEVCRGIAFALKKYFSELPENVKKAWCAETKAPSPSALFGDDHVAILATRMTLADNVDEVGETLKQAFAENHLSWMDVDVVLPAGTIKETSCPTETAEDLDESRLLRQKYGKYADLIESLGDVSFLPTSKMKRAPSKVSSIGRTASFLRHQKEQVRKEVTELVETEISYVQRTRELCQVSDRLGADLDPDLQDRLRGVFPSSISTITATNEAFLEGLREVFDSTDPEALRDIMETPEDQSSLKDMRQGSAQDSQGIGEIAGCLCEWLPKFKGCYGDYLRDHATCVQLLRDLSRAESTIAAAVQEVGEQKLTSLLIEPVQRLPRYSLYIDTITKQLPARHPAIKKLLKARDLVSEICDQETPGSSASMTIEKLRAQVSGWPSAGLLSGRLITAADIVELNPPYSSHNCEGTHGVLLLFSDGVVFLDKVDSESTSARNLLAELETGHVLSRSASSRPASPHDLTFARCVPLAKFDCLEGADGKTLQVFISEDGVSSPGSQPRHSSCQTLRLQGFYERKVERLAEEIIKARVEGRFSEAEREGLKWEVRASDPVADTANLFAAVFEDSNNEHIHARKGTASTRLIVDIDRHSHKPRAGQKALRTIICVTPLRDGFWRLTFDSIDGTVNHETIEVSDIAPMIRRRLAALSSARFAIDGGDMTVCLLARNAAILRTVDTRTSTDDNEVAKQSPVREKVKQPKSPRKFLSSFLSSSGAESQLPALLKKDLPPLPPPAAPRYSIATQSKPPSRESRPSSRDQPTPKSISSMLSSEQLSSPIRKLEETLSCYVLALHARKGNIVGRSLKMRSAADELAVNELYNTLLEDPNTMTLAAQASVDVLFAAFEKFLNVAWREQIGQILPLSLLQEIQSKAETMFPTDFDAYFRSALETLPPQNQRAFKGIMKLLADLLDGTGNDSDRGSLTAAFAEVLVPEGNAHSYIALIDRFVDDPDTYFGEPLEEVQKPSNLAAGSHKRARSVNSASVTSNTSSLRRKFGLGALSRENSKSEPESKMASVWRTLSKTARGDASPGSSISKASLHRSYTTDADARSLPSRPQSQDGSVHNAGLAAEDVSLVSTSSAHNLSLSTIGEHPSFIPKQPARKKRRSSLSDLQALDDITKNSPMMAPPAIRLPVATKKSSDNITSRPLSSPPSTPSSKNGTAHFRTPSKEPMRSRLPPSFRKENSPAAPKALGAGTEQSIFNAPATEQSPMPSRSPSSIPTLMLKHASPQKAPSPAPRRTSGLSERRDAGNAVKKPSPSPEKGPNATSSSTTPSAALAGAAGTGSPTKKLRMQSPQKLRERLHNEQNAVAAVQNSLQEELSQIGDELTASSPSRMSSIRTTGRCTGVRSHHQHQQQGSSIDLAARVLKMEGLLSQRFEELQTRLAGIQADLATSLVVSESKCKKLDALYREANGENEALYTRFNDELGKILKAVKGGDGVEEMKRKMLEAQEEAAKLKRENGRLKRENLGLRSQLKE